MEDRDDDIKELAVLKGAVENTNEAFVTIDQKQKVLFFNKAAEKIFGYSREEVLGQDLDVIMSPNCSRDHHRAVSRYIETGVPRRIGHHTEIMASRKNGETFPADISFSISRADGRLYFTAIVRDLTETKALQDRINRSERLAALGQVVAEISHEIKNPLMMIGGFARQLVKESKDEKSLAKLNIIVKEVQRLESLLKEMRDYYLPRPLDRKEIDVNALLKEVHDLIKEDCKKRSIRLEFKTDREQVLVEGDRAKLEQVLLNLAKNALEAMEQGGKISFASGLKEGVVEIKISDEGIGIPEEDQGKIFSPFYTTKKQGTGLGLSICKRIIEDHPGSSLSFASEKGKGSAFVITMPVSRSAKAFSD
ncbi:MAG: sensor signal transduction histidine kinase [Deltaproteobacteria bacterium]|jgi:PAS domain S-box-containing protein|nr:sensor signal transduction histidine kinase [Deltaproteobacteria bacterium]